MSATGFQGEPGAFSEEAIVALMGDIPTRGYRTFDDLVGAVAVAEIEFGLLPCENTMYGSIARSYDLIAEHPQLRVVDETTHPIVQAVVGAPGSCLEDITTIASHPVALEQCREFLSRQPDLRIQTADDTAGAIRTVVEIGDVHVAAIGSALAAHRYGGRILAQAIQDPVENLTRFFLIAHQSAARRNLGRALLAFELPHRAGSLHQALGLLAERSLNLRNLVARPSRRAAFEYRFYAEFDCPNGFDAANIATRLGPNTRILGIY